MTIDGKLLRGVFEHERLKPVVLKTDKGNVNTFPALSSEKGHELRNNLTCTPHQLISIHYRTNNPLKQIPAEEIIPPKITIIYIF